MADFYELDFFPVHTSKSGDAISIKYQLGNRWSVHVIDGGYTSTADAFAKHIRSNYGTNRINRMIVTHPDKDHAEGLAPLLETFEVEQLWMLRPWQYIDEVMPHFARYTNPDNLRRTLKEAYPYIDRLEQIANRRGIPIFEPFQGAAMGPFTVLAPSRSRYLQLVVESAKTPQQSQASKLSFGLDAFLEAARTFIKAGWGHEKFSDEPTSNENEMSVVQYAHICDRKILLTGDAGRDGLEEAANYAPFVGLHLPGVDLFQVPHHGGRRNLSTALLNRLLGPTLPGLLPAGHERFVAMISSAKEDIVHPRKAVVRGLLHRGAMVRTTEEYAFCLTAGVTPQRPGWGPLGGNVPYPDENED
ncbi:competence protein ComEC [Rhizobium sp. MHM7A]|uniref:ComEC/Rec2 family competence protein n=1 Tax=Rhizobium sp. MHM7A TaxID=2583233 RepID=UPI001106296C|nr:competence protein ComEC [Rhizobium sp. MHM7A]TLX03699.1 competence protein ComEC [Rhizobium sp. MHM7A]